MPTCQAQVSPMAEASAKATFESGTRVVVDGLVGRKDLNSCHGNVIGPKGDRICVSVERADGQTEEVQLRAANLKVVAVTGGGVKSWILGGRRKQSIHGERQPAAHETRPRRRSMFGRVERSNAELSPQEVLQNEGFRKYLDDARRLSTVAPENVEAVAKAEVAERTRDFAEEVKQLHIESGGLRYQPENAKESRKICRGFARLAAAQAEVENYPPAAKAVAYHAAKVAARRTLKAGGTVEEARAASVEAGKLACNEGRTDSSSCSSGEKSSSGNASSEEDA